jgi:drug/metabolite transporter (DMT)-like permease
MTGHAIAPPGIPLAPVVVAGLVMVVWGATPVMTKLATAEMPPLVVAMLRTALGGLAALPLLAGLRQPLPRDRKLLGFLVVSALSGFVIFPVLYTIGQRQTSAMHGGMILAALPIFTGTYAALLDRTRPTRRWLIGCALALESDPVRLKHILSFGSS